MQIYFINCSNTTQNRNVNTYEYFRYLGALTVEESGDIKYEINFISMYIRLR